MRAKWAVAAVVVILFIAGGGVMYALRDRLGSHRSEHAIVPSTMPTAPVGSTGSSPSAPPPIAASPPPAPAVSSAAPPETALPSVPAVPSPVDPAAMAKVQKNRQAVETFPGWLGVDVRLGQFVLVVVEMNDQAPATKEFKSQFTTPCQVLWISADNSHGDLPHTMDPTSLEFHFADYHTLAVIPPSQVLASAKPPVDATLSRSNATAVSIEPKSVMPDIPAFLPAGTDLSQAVAVTMKVDGQQVVIPGRYLSVDEKAERLRAGQQAQQQLQAQSAATTRPTSP